MSVTPAGMPSADHWPHGVRARYSAGCRCDECRAANTAYERKRARHRVWHGPDVLVDAKRARQHLKRLSRKDVGRRTVGAAADVGDTTLSKIIAGTKKQIRCSTEKRILEVDVGAAADAARTDAGPTWKLLNQLLKRGWSKAELARRLGYKRAALQFNKRSVLVKTAHQVKLLHAELIKLPPPSGVTCKCTQEVTVERDGIELCALCERPRP